MVRQVLLWASEREWISHVARTSHLTRAVSRRFVAGDALHDAVCAVRNLDGNDMSVSLDALGEHTHTAAGAREVHTVYCAVLDRIAREQLNANVSLKLTQLGLDVDEQLCASLLTAIVECAARLGNFVRIDMESSRYIQRTLDICRAVREKSDAVGVVIQAYLYRSERDVRDLVQQGCRVRLCKGAYREGADVAFTHKRDVDASFVRLMRLLLTSGIYHGIATHDPRILDATVDFAESQGIPKSAYEFQMLYGIRRDLAASLVREGHKVRIYVPFGAQWFGYFMRRLAERPANLLFFLKNVVRSG